MKTFIETDTLLLREMVPEDAGGMFELDSDPLVHRYLGNRPVQHIQQSLDTIEFVRKQYRELGIGRWAVIDKPSGAFAGWAGLKYHTEPYNGLTGIHDLGYRFIRRFWGKGLGTACAGLVLDYGFNIMELDEIYAAAHVENIASNKILVRMGFTRHGECAFEEQPHHWYMLERTSWGG